MRTANTPGRCQIGDNPGFIATTLDFIVDPSGSRSRVTEVRVEKPEPPPDDTEKH
jgi:hypothetical protein